MYRGEGGVMEYGAIYGVWGVYGVIMSMGGRGSMVGCE